MMDDIRKGQIALLFLKHKFREEGVRLNPNNMRREIGNVAKATGVPLEEAMVFVESVVDELVEEVFAKKSD